MRLSVTSALCLAVALAPTLPARAAQVVQMDLQALSKNAEVIAVGRCTGTSAGWNAEHTHIYTTVTIQVSQYLKGFLGPQIQFRQLGGKVGCAAGMAHDLRLEARDRGLDADGISVHVGSQQTDPAQWVGAIARTADLFGELRQAGLSPTTINLGGGFPVAYRDPVPSFAAIADAISGALDDNFGSRRPRLIIEPGRCIAAEAGVLESEVVLVSAKDYGDEVRWVYLDVGRFSDLAETLGEAITYPIECDRRGGADDGPVILAGPTCDGADVLYEDAGYTLPLDLAAGDRLRLLKTGAYTATYSSVGFNGFAPLVEYYV